MTKFTHYHFVPSRSPLTPLPPPPLLTACRDGCVENLFEEIDSMSAVVAAVNLTGSGGAPWGRYYTVSNTTETMLEQLQKYQESQLTLRAMYETMDLSKYATTILIQVSARRVSEETEGD